MSRALPVVERDARPVARVTPEDEGWTRRFVAAGERLEEATRLYGEMGFAVRLEPTSADDLRDECTSCRLALETFRVIYTRRGP